MSRGPAPDPHDQCFIYTKQKFWLALPKVTDPAGKGWALRYDNAAWD